MYLIETESAAKNRIVALEGQVDSLKEKIRRLLYSISSLLLLIAYLFWLIFNSDVEEVNRLKSEEEEYLLRIRSLEQQLDEQQRSKQ